jgi:hypothetical protein
MAFGAICYYGHPMFWLTFETSRGVEVYIVEARHLMMARVRAGMAGQQGQFQEGHELDAQTAKKIPARMIRRTLSHKEAFALLKKIS